MFIDIIQQPTMSTTQQTVQTTSRKNLPDAKTLTAATRSAPAAQERQQRKENNEKERAAREARIQENIVSYTQHLLNGIPAVIEEAMEKGFGYASIGSFHPYQRLRSEAGQQEEQDDEGEDETLPEPRFPAEETHWAGEGVDPSVGGTLKTMMVLGRRVGRVSYPDRLPGGKSVLDLLRAELGPKGYDLDCMYYRNRSQFVIYLIWDKGAWANYTTRRETFIKQRAEQSAERRGAESSSASKGSRSQKSGKSYNRQ